jgi:hypothetical protein
MVYPNNPLRRFYASRVTRTLYLEDDRVVIWRGQFRGESGSVVASVGKKLHVVLETTNERILERTNGGVVVVLKSSCCLIA